MPSNQPPYFIGNRTQGSIQASLKPPAYSAQSKLRTGIHSGASGRYRINTVGHVPKRLTLKAFRGLTSPLPKIIQFLFHIFGDSFEIVLGYFEKSESKYKTPASLIMNEG